MKKRLRLIMLLLSIILVVSALSGPVTASSVEKASSAHLDSAEGKVVIPQTVEESEYKILTEAEFLERYHQLTGESVNQLRSELQQRNDPIGIAQDFPIEYREYQIIIDLGGSVKARAGVLASVQPFLIGYSLVHRFVTVYDNTAYLSAHTGGTFTVHKNYAIGIKESDTSMYLTASGYSETAVVNERSEGLNLTVGQLVNYGWSHSYSISTTKYYRKDINAAQRFSP